MVNKIVYDQMDFEKIGVAEAKRNDLTNKKGKVTGYWYSIGLNYLYPNGERDNLLIRFPGVKTTGVTKNEYEDEKSGRTTTKYQFGTIGNLEEKYVKFFDSLRLAICEAVLKSASNVDYLEGFDPKAKKANPKRFYWQDKKNKARRAWYPQIGYNTSLFIPDSKSKSKTAPVSKSKFIENRAKKIHYVIEQTIDWKINYFYAGATILSIKNEIHKTLITKLEAKGASWDDPEEVERLLKNNPDIEAQIEENFKTARTLTAQGDDDDDEGDDDESGDEQPKKAKGKGKATGNQKLKAFMDDDDDEDEEEEEEPKKKSKRGGSSRKKVSDEEEDEDEEEEEPKKGKRSTRKKTSDDEEEDD